MGADCTYAEGLADAGTAQMRNTGARGCNSGDGPTTETADSDYHSADGDGTLCSTKAPPRGRRR
eukprot:10831042-Alexandrium_andersonii.AAC.1